MFAAHHAYMCLISLATWIPLLRLTESLDLIKARSSEKLSFQNFLRISGFFIWKCDSRLSPRKEFSRFRFFPFEAGGQTVEKVEQLLNDEDWRAHCEARQPVTLEKNERREENKKRRQCNEHTYTSCYIWTLFILSSYLSIYLSILFISFFVLCNYVFMYLCLLSIFE